MSLLHYCFMQRADNNGPEQPGETPMLSPSREGVGELTTSTRPGPGNTVTHLRQASYVSDEKYALVRLALGVCAAGSENLSLVSDWRSRILAEWLPSNFQLLAAVPRLVPEAVPRMAELEDGQRAGEGFAAELELGAHFGEAYNERDPSPDIGVLLSVLCKVDIDSACEGRGAEAGEGGIKQMLLQRLGGSEALPRRVATALLGRELDTVADDGLVVTLQADDVLFLEYIYTSAAQTWLPLHCTPNDPLCLPPPPPLGGAAGAGRYCALEVSLEPCVLVMPSPQPSPVNSCSGGGASSAASTDWDGGGCTLAMVSVSVEEWRSPLLDVWPDEVMTQEPIRLEPQEEEGAAEARRQALADPNSWDPSSPSAVQLIRRRGDVVVHMPARRCRHQQHLGAPCPQPYAGLLVVEVWRGTVLCGVGHAVLVEQEQEDCRSNSAPTPGAPRAPTPLVSDHMRHVPLRGMALGGSPGGLGARGSWESVSTEAGSFEYATVRAPQAAAARIAQDPRSLLLQDLGLFLVYATAHAGDSLSPSFMGQQLRSRLQVHEALVRAGCRVLDAAVEAGLPALAAALHRRLRGLGCSDKQLLMGGVQRPAGLPLLHLALLSGCHGMALLALEWCNASKGVKGLTKPVTVVLPAAPDAGAVAGAFARSSLDAAGAPGAGKAEAYNQTVVDPLQLAQSLGLHEEVSQLGFHFPTFSSPTNTYRPLCH
eukprot:XP_001691105.1 predicted protein [Chlamydomonas reinhardtii]